MKKRFTMIDENFICENCGKVVKKLGYSARDHCPYCLYSKHVDIFPGDRENTCKGLLKPMGIDVYIIKDHHNPERFSLDYNQLPETDAIYKVSGTSKKIYNPSPMDIFANDWTYVGNE